MKVSCLQENLARGLSIVGRAVATRSTLPILGHIKLETDEGRLKLSATNLEIGIHCWIGAQVHEEGATTVPARLLSDFVNSLPPDRIDMRLNPRTQALQLQCARFTANIKGLEAQDFPLIPTAGGDHRIQMDPALLREMIGQVAFAAATDESRPILTGVLVTCAEGALTMAAADGFRLSVRSETIGGPPTGPLEVIIPARALNELSRILGDETEPVEITVTANQVVFSLTTVELVSRLIEGRFPDYRQIIPSRYDLRATMSIPDFLKAVRIAALFARDAANVVRLELAPGPAATPGRIIVTSSADQVGDNVGEVDAIIEGEAAVIAFNAKFLIDVLGAMSVGSDQVALEMTTSSSPGVFKPVGKAGFIHVIMPMHLGAR